MTTPAPQQASFPTPHTCRHCSTFIIYLIDESAVAEARDGQVSYPPNPSQERLALKLFGDDFWADEWTEYRNYFFQRTGGISFFDVSKTDLERFARQGCLLSQRYIESLRDDELPDRYAVGAILVKGHAWSVELCSVDLDNWRVETLLAEGDEDPDNTYSMLAEEGTPAAQVLDNHAINMQPNTVSSLSTARGWLMECLQDHKECPMPDPTFTPTRLVQITPTCRLCEMETHVKPYAALSYCWGGEQVFKTTMHMRPRYLEAIDSTQLPQTLQDAIYVAQQFGLQYIWIDALCIIQDCIPDKAVEIGRMAQVYGNATITIGATRSSAVWNGFLSARSLLAARSPNSVFSLPCRLNNRDMGQITLIPYTSEGIEALDTRGWTFQERVFSPRIIDFGTLRTQYTCKTPLAQVSSDGWSHLPLDRPYGSGLDAQLIANLLAGLHPPEDMLIHWMAIVEGFTSRGLAFATDKLPAIAGMSEQFGVLMEDQYCAGLWRSGMPANLLWTKDDRVQQIYNDFEPRLSGANVAAPSWSWASVSRAVTHNRTYTVPRKGVSLNVRIDGCDISLVDKRTPYGATSSGSLVLTTYAQEALWSFHHDATILFSAPNKPDVEQYLHSGHGTGSTGITFVPDALEKDFEDNPKSELRVWMLLFGTDKPGKGSGLNPSLFGLVVRRARGGEQYSRVGVFNKTVDWEGFRAYMGWFKQGDVDRFVIT